LHPGQLAWIAPSVEHRVDDLSQDADFWSLQVEPSLVRSAYNPTQIDERETSASVFGETYHALPDPPVVDLARHHVDAIEEAAHAAWSLYLTSAVGQQPADPNFGWIPPWQASCARAARESLMRCYGAAHAATLSEVLRSPRKNIIGHAFERMLVDPTISRRELSSVLDVSEGYLSRRFPEVFGVSLVTQRARLRLVQFLSLAKAQARPNLLRSSLEAGFGSYAQLHRVFRYHSSSTPSDYVLGTGRLVAGSLVR
jgi:AraC-like DNA-binding protein